MSEKSSLPVSDNLRVLSRGQLNTNFRIALTCVLSNILESELKEIEIFGYLFPYKVHSHKNVKQNIHKEDCDTFNLHIKSDGRWARVIQITYSSRRLGRR